MLKSMTGYGKAEIILPDKKVIVEIKSLNSKNTDINIKLPPVYREKELLIRQMIYDRLIRGKIDLSIFYEMNEGVTISAINKENFRSVYREIRELADEFNLKTGDGVIQAILRLPDTIKMNKNEPDENEWEMIREGIGKAISQLDEFRTQEGQSMFYDLTERVSTILTHLKDVVKYEEPRIRRLRERIDKNLTEAGLIEEIDRNRFEQEMIFYIERLDISEEKIRLQNHCDYFTNTMSGEEASGKKLSFISQEMGREINTLGSKANDSDIQHLVVKMKDELEKIKEQIANIL